MDDLTRRLNKLKKDNYTGTVTLSFYKGSISKKIKLEVTEVMNKSQKLNLDKFFLGILIILFEVVKIFLHEFTNNLFVLPNTKLGS